MSSLSLAYVKKHIDEAVDLAETGTVIITRDSGDNLVLLREAEWRALQETVQLLVNPLNAERLLQSLQQARAELLTELP